MVRAAGRVFMAQLKQVPGKKMLFLSLLRAGDQNRVIKIQSHPGLLSEVGLFCLNKGRIGMGLMSSLKGDFKFSCLRSVISVLDQELE